MNCQNNGCPSRKPSKESRKKNVQIHPREKGLRTAVTYPSMWKLWTTFYLLSGPRTDHKRCMPACVCAGCAGGEWRKTLYSVSAVGQLGKMYTQNTFVLGGDKSQKGCHGDIELFRVPGSCRVWRAPGGLATQRWTLWLWRVLLMAGADLVGTEAALHSKDRAAFNRSTMTFSGPQGEKHSQVGPPQTSEDREERSDCSHQHRGAVWLIQERIGITRGLQKLPGHFLESYPSERR